MSRHRTWLVEGTDGACTVTRNGRELARGLNEAEAVRFIRRKVFRGDKVFRVDPDGYRRPLRTV